MYYIYNYKTFIILIVKLIYFLYINRYIDNIKFITSSIFHFHLNFKILQMNTLSISLSLTILEL